MEAYYHHTTDFDRHGCTVGAKRVTYRTLEQWYVCRECGGKPVHRFGRENDQPVDWAECSQCGTRDFIPQWLYDRQVVEFPVIVANLPDELRELFPQPEPLNITAQEAADSLYGL